MSRCDLCGERTAPRSVRQGFIENEDGTLKGESKIISKYCPKCETLEFERFVRAFGGGQWDYDGETTEEEYLQGIEVSLVPEFVGSTASEYTKRISQGIQLNEEAA